MFNNLSNLYHELILEHSRHPRNFGELCVPPAIRGIGSNPLCGDNLITFLHIEKNIIKKIAYMGSGCAIFISASSILSTILENKTCDQARALLEKFSKIITLGEEFQTDHKDSKFEKLKVFVHIKEYPARVKCAMLFARTVESLLKNPEGYNEVVTSEF